MRTKTQKVKQSPVPVWIVLGYDRECQNIYGADNGFACFDTYEKAAGAAKQAVIDGEDSPLAGYSAPQHFLVAQVWGYTCSEPTYVEIPD